MLPGAIARRPAHRRVVNPLPLTNPSPPPRVSVSRLPRVPASPVPDISASPLSLSPSLPNEQGHSFNPVQQVVAAKLDIVELSAGVKRGDGGVAHDLSSFPAPEVLRLDAPQVMENDGAAVLIPNVEHDMAFNPNERQKWNAAL